MGSIELCSLPTIMSLVGMVQGSDEPLVVLDEGSECLIAMRPAVFERILFDTDLLNQSDRSTMHL